MGDVSLAELVATLLEGDRDGAASQARELTACGVGRDRIIAEGVEAALAQFDAKCTVEQYNLLEIILTGRAVMGVIKELYPLGASRPLTHGTVVLATLEGDVHDLGKNIFKTILTMTGYRVVECGTNCSIETLVASAAREAPIAVGISGLLTTGIPQVRHVKAALDERGLGNAKVMVGGAALRQASAGQLDVDFVAQTAFDGLHYLNGISDCGVIEGGDL